jgi:hypothetical protein
MNQTATARCRWSVAISATAACSARTAQEGWDYSRNVCRGRAP